MMALQRSHFCQGKFVRGSRSGEHVKDYWLIRSGTLEVIRHWNNRTCHGLWV
jgi:hypothetical protein